MCLVWATSCEACMRSEISAFAMPKILKRQLRHQRAGALLVEPDSAIRKGRDIHTLTRCGMGTKTELGRTEAE